MNKITVGIVIIAVLLIASNATWAYYSMVVLQPSSTVKPIKIGVLLPFTGSTAFIGENARAAARLAMDEINEMGGILGRPVEIVVADDAGDAQTATTQYQKLVSVYKIDALIGVHRSAVALALMDLISQYRTPTIFVGPGSVTITQRITDNYDKYKTVFRLNTNSTVNFLPRAGLILDVLMPKFNVTKYGLMTEDVTAGVEEHAILKSYLANNSGPQLVYEAKVSPTAIDYSAEIVNQRNSGAQVICVYMTTTSAVTYLKQAHEAQVPFVIMDAITMFFSNDGIIATKESGNYFTGLSFGINKAMTEKTVPFFDKYYARTGWWPQSYAFHEYDAFYVFKNAVERAGSLEESMLIPALETTNWTGSSGKIVFTSSHDLLYGEKYTWMPMVQWFWENNAARAEIVWPANKASAQYQVPPWVTWP